MKLRGAQSDFGTVQRFIVPLPRLEAAQLRQSRSTDPSHQTIYWSRQTSGHMLAES